MSAFSAVRKLDKGTVLIKVLLLLCIEKEIIMDSGGSDGIPLFGGIAAGKPFGIIGAVVGAMAGDRAKDGIKDKIPTDQDIQLTKGSSKGK